MPEQSTAPSSAGQSNIKYNPLQFIKRLKSNDRSSQDEENPLRPNQPQTEKRNRFNVQRRAEDSPNRSPPPERTRPFQTRLQFVRHWWPEMLAALLGLAMLFTLVAILDTRQGNPLPQWPYHISVNAVVSVLTIILKASMLFVLAEGLGELKWAWYRRSHPLKDIETFDEASRGPWGSLRLIAMLRGRNGLSTIGAVVIIVALAVEPFSQQLLQYYNCVRTVPHQASLPRTQYYRGQNPTHLFAGMSSVDYGLESQGYGGIFAPSPLQVDFECPSGNCTFPDFSTVGLCSHCYELHGIQYEEEDADEHTEHEDSEGLPIARRYYLPGGTSLFQSNNESTTPPFEPFEFLVGNFTPNERGSGFGSNVTLEFLSANPYWTSVQNGEGQVSGGKPPGCSAPPLNTTWPCKDAGAANCTIGICVKEYHAEVRSGRLVETVESATTDFFLTSDYTLLDTTCLPPLLRTRLVQQGNITTGARFQPYDPTPPPADAVPDECYYRVEMPSASGISRFLGEFLTGNVSFSFRDEISAPPIYPSVTKGPVQLQQLWKQGNMTLESLNGMLDAMTESMTSYMRMKGEANVSAPVMGDSLVYDTCIGVKWDWLILPAALEAVTVVFLVILMLSVKIPHSGSSSAWKTSALALMFHGLDREILDRDGGRLHRMNEMKETAGRLKVRMEPSGRGWKLVEDIRIVR